MWESAPCSGAEPPPQHALPIPADGHYVGVSASAHDQYWQAKVDACEAKHEQDALALITHVEQLQGLLSEQIESSSERRETQHHRPSDWLLGQLGQAECERRHYEEEACEQRNSIAELYAELDASRRQERSQRCQELLQPNDDLRALQRFSEVEQNLAIRAALETSELRESLARQAAEQRDLRLEARELMAERTVTSKAAELQKGRFEAELVVLKTHVSAREAALRSAAAELREGELRHRADVQQVRAACRREAPERLQAVESSARRLVARSRDLVTAARAERAPAGHRSGGTDAQRPGPIRSLRPQLQGQASPEPRTARSSVKAVARCPEAAQDGCVASQAIHRRALEAAIAEVLRAAEGVEAVLPAGR